jgi:hypothetical protein
MVGGKKNRRMEYTRAIINPARKGRYPNVYLCRLFFLDPEIVFLNYGSFGAMPRPVFDVYQSRQRELERQRVQFLGTAR